VNRQTGPIRRLFGGYQRQDLLPDLLAGSIVAVMLVPQAMAYSLLAGLPPHAGLYSAAAAALVYPLLGSSRYLAVGPVAIVSLLVATGLSALEPSGPAEYAAYAVTLASLVGFLKLALGLARLGFLVNLLSHAVISGFTSAAALVIALSQVKLLLGIRMPRTESLPDLLVALASRLGESNVHTLLLGIGGILLLLVVGHGVRPVLRRAGVSDAWLVPIARSAPLVLVVSGTLLVLLFDLDRVAGVSVVGAIPPGLPAIGLPSLDLAAWRVLMPTALAITFVGYAESFAVARSLASKRRERVAPDRELVALGAANVAASLAGGYPVTGGFSRSVVNFTAGARTRAASVVTGVVVVLTLLFLTPLFSRLPHVALAAIIVVAVVQLVDVRTMRQLWLYNRADGTAALLTFAAVLTVSVETGILVGVASALALHLWRTSRPHLAVVGRVGDTEHYRNELRHQVHTEPGVLAVRIDESLYFPNAAHLEERLLNLVAERPGVRHLLLIMSAVNFIDGSALETLRRLIHELAATGVELHLAEVKGPVMDRLRRIDFLDNVDAGRVFLTTHEAMRELAGLETAKSARLTGEEPGHHGGPGGSSIG
jgi:SulP family sulfate permease